MKTKTTDIKCPECGKIVKGEQGLKVHMGWTHDPKKREIRMQAAKRVGAERAAVNRGESVKRTRGRKKSGEAPMPMVSYCPKCGCNLEAVSLALGFQS